MLARSQKYEYAFQDGFRTDFEMEVGDQIYVNCGSARDCLGISGVRLTSEPRITPRRDLHRPET